MQSAPDRVQAGGNVALSVCLSDCVHAMACTELVAYQIESLAGCPLAAPRIIRLGLAARCLQRRSAAKRAQAGELMWRCGTQALLRELHEDKMGPRLLLCYCHGRCCC
jgi:hypothetical protein